MAFGLTPFLPLTMNKENGIALIQAYSVLVRQNFKNLLLTIPGERIMDANFGVGLNQFLFELDNPQLYDNITGKIHEQVNKYLPYVEILSLSFKSGATHSTMDPNALFISLKYNVVPLKFVDKLDISLPDN